jgi:O-antigen/teichoic acid export membrane protein
MASNVRQKISSGIGWNFANQMFAGTLHFVVMVILARLLTPHDYGVVGLVLAFTGCAALFVDLGLTPAIIQKQDITQTELTTVFWTNNAMGWIILALLWVLAEPIATFYREPVLIWVTRITAFSFVLTPLISLPRALLQRNLRFRTLTRVNVAALIVSSGVAICFAAKGFRYWSLVAQTLAGSATTALFLWWAVKWRPSFAFSGIALHRFFGFSGYLSASQIIGYWSRNLDKVMLGRMVGTAELGLYTRGYTLMLLPVQQISKVVDPVLFPAYSMIQHDRHQIAQIYLKITRLVALLTFPICFGLWATAEPAVLAVLGERWRDTIPIVKLLCPLGALQSILSLNSSLYLSQGRTRRALVVRAVSTAALAGVFYFGLKTGGLMGMVWGYLVYSIVASPFIYLAAATLVNLRLSDMLKNLSGVSFATFLMAAGVVCFRPLLAGSSNIVQLLVLAPLGATIYVLSLNVLGITAFKEALRLIQSKEKRSKAIVASKEVEQVL